jgi:hypothetical protein
MNGADASRRRRRVQTAVLVVLLIASALETVAITAGLPVLRDSLMALIAVTMLVAAARG